MIDKKNMVFSGAAKDEIDYLVAEFRRHLYSESIEFVAIQERKRIEVRDIHSILSEVVTMLQVYSMAILSVASSKNKEKNNVDSE